MRRTSHRTLLQSFRFWFILLSVFALAAAWKLDLFGNRRPLRHGREVAEEKLPEPEHDLEPVEMLSDVASVTSPAPEPIDLEGVSPAPLPPRSTPRPRPSTELAASNPVRPQAPAPRNPFGPANPEFVAITEDSATFEDAPRRPLSANPLSAPADGQDLSTIRPYERGQSRQTASLEPTPPDLTQTRPVRPEVAAARQAPARDWADDRIERVSNSQPAGRSGIVEPAAAAAQKPFALPEGSKVDLAAISRLQASGDDVEALRIMSEWYWKEPQSRPAFQSQLDQLAKKIYLQPHPHYMDPHVVQQGQMLSSIAKEYNVPWQYLAKLNRTDAKRIKPGQKLKVIKGPFSAVVDLSDFELTIHAHGYVVKRYQVGIGRDNSSPYGQFKVQDKLTDPTYYGPTQVIEHDDPENPLGEYWISIGDSFGIHGTIDPNSIGKAESEGCIRLRNEDIAEVYDFLSVGSDVTIRP
jgi:lipoprotein-anchoring transpeptidase ErfK/SrfK